MPSLRDIEDMGIPSSLTGTRSVPLNPTQGAFEPGSGECNVPVPTGRLPPDAFNAPDHDVVHGAGSIARDFHGITQEYHSAASLAT